MATSGLTAFNPTAEQIIREALEQLKVVAPGESISGEDYVSCLYSLNALVKHLQNKGIFIHTQTEGTIFMSPGVAKYTLGGSSPSKASRGVMIETSLSTDEVTSSTAIDVESTTGMTAGDVIGVVLDDLTTHWTTIATVVDSNSLTLTTGLASAATTGNMIYTYTTAIGKPLKILNAQLRRVGGTTTALLQSTYDTTMTQMSHQKYKNISSKNTQGTPNSFTFQAKSSDSEFHVWPTPFSSTYRIKVTFLRVIEDFSSSTDTADFPQEWAAALSLSLAVFIADKYVEGGAPITIQSKAQTLLADALASQVTGSITFKPGM